MNRYILYWTVNVLYYVSDDESDDQEFNKRMNAIHMFPGVLGTAVTYDTPPEFAICADTDD